jgi:hypothetical protein
MKAQIHCQKSFSESVTGPAGQEIYPIFTEQNLSLLFAHDHSLETYHQAVEYSSVLGILLRAE